MKTQETRENRPGSNRSGQSATDTRQGGEMNRNVARRNDLSSHFLFDPFDLMRSFLNQSRLSSPWTAVSGRSDRGEWAPQIESFQRGNEFVVRADLPGLEQKDISVELKDDAVVIEGERSNQREEQEDGYYRSERSYGRFCRMIPLPEGAISDSAKASFKNGVLEVVLQAPPHEVSRGRRIEITEGKDEKR
jgi:HSP20 family protein